MTDTADELARVLNDAYTRGVCVVPYTDREGTLYSVERVEGSTLRTRTVDWDPQRNRWTVADEDDAPEVLTDSLTYVTIGESPATTQLRADVENLAARLNEMTRDRDKWEARTRKLLGEKSGRISPINGCTETTCGCQHLWSCRD